MTNWLFYINFAIFSAFLTLFFTELMGSVLLLVAYEDAKKRVLSYVVPIWEVTGTFAAFWVVTSDFAFPSMLIPVATLWAGLIVVFLILFVARNFSISFAELIVTKGWLNERRLYKAYALSTVLIGLAVLVVLSEIVSGAGIELSTLTFSFPTWVTTPSTWLYVAGVFLIGIGLAPVFYDLRALRRLAVPFVAAGIAVEVVALFLFSHSFLSPWLVLPVILTLLVPVLYVVPFGARIVSNKVVFAVTAGIILFSLNYLVYPTAFNGAINVDSVTATGAMASAFLILSVAGLVIVGGLMALYLFAVKKAARAGSEPGGGRAATVPPATGPRSSVR